MSLLREIGHEAMWIVSSAKPGNGIECLRDGKEGTFWQSEGTQPHFINMEFQTLTEVAEVRLGLDFKQDESYTPQRISIRIGPSFNLLREVRILELEEPNGEICVPLCWNRNELTREDSAADDQDATSEELVPIEVFCIQIAILSNHQNGRDAHVRSVSVYARSKGQGQGPDPLKQAIIR